MPTISSHDGTHRVLAVESAPAIMCATVANRSFDPAQAFGIRRQEFSLDKEIALFLHELGEAGSVLRRA